MGFVKKLEEYLDDIAFVNKSEVSMAVQDFLIEEMGVEQLSMSDILEADKIAKDYIEKKGLKFNPDLVVTLDRKSKAIHLSDLNNEFNEKQVARMERIYQNAFLNACDCLYYWYGRQAWNACGIEEEDEQAKIWQAAKNYMANDY